MPVELLIKYFTQSDDYKEVAGQAASQLIKVAIPSSRTKTKNARWKLGLQCCMS